MAHPDGWVHGKDGKFFIGAQDFNVTEFSGDWEVDSADITHTGAAGARVVIDGVEKFDGSVTFIYNVQHKPTVAPQQLKPRTYATVHLKPDGADDFSCLCLCTKFSFKSGPKSGEVSVTVTLMSTGPISYPIS